MTLLLASEPVELFPPGQADQHGWAEPGSRPYWCGQGNLQLLAGLSDPRAAEGGGAGPYDPAAVQTGLLYLPAEAQARDGTTAKIRGTSWVLSQVRLVMDPLGSGLDCMAATATGTGSWPDG